MMARNHSRSAVAMLLASSAVLAGCSQETSTVPTTTTSTTLDARAADFAAAEQAIRGADADLEKNGRYTDERWMNRDVMADQNAVADKWKKQGLTVKGTAELLSMKHSSYEPAAGSLSIDTCHKVTGGIYDRNGKNVATDAAGKPVSDKRPHRVKQHIRLGQAQGESWRIASIKVLTDPC